MNSKQLKKSISLSIVAQIVSLLVSAILNLIVPKYVSVVQYSYWQTYLLYISYVGILHFGLLDGLVLRYSQYDYDELNKPLFRSQFQALFCIDLFISSIIIIFTSIKYSGVSFWLIALISLGIITRNIFTYTSYTFQITNRIKLYAFLVLAQRLFYGIGIMLFVFLGKDNFILFCITDLLADVFGIIIGSFFNKGLYFGSLIPWDDFKHEFIENITAGALLLIANLSSQLLTGAAKMVIQWHWHLLTFGKLSFSFSVSALFLTFITAISVVLFPSLKRMDPNELPALYTKIRELINPILFFSLLLYFPGFYLLQLWLPKYSDSLVYLGIMLPTIIFSSKVSLLTNNYLKAYRREKDMLVINVLVMIIGFSLYLVSAYIFDNINLLLYSLVIIIMFRSVVSEMVVMKLIDCRLHREFVIEGMITVLFIICAQLSNSHLGFIGYALIFSIYLAYYFSKKYNKSKMV